MTDTTAALADQSRDWRFYWQKNVVVLFLLGFSAGLPFLLVYSTLSAWLKDAGLQMSTISTFAWLGFAYSLKFVWAPFIDSLPVPGLTRLLGRRRSWLLVAQLAIAAALLLLATSDPSEAIGVFAIIALVVAFSSATQDIVIDAYRIECAPNEMQGILAAAYQYGYRLALLVAGAGALYIAQYGSWPLAYTTMAAFMVVGIGTTLWCREPEVAGFVSSYNGLSAVARLTHWFRHAVADPFIDFFQRFGRFALVIIVFILCFRLSDYVLGILANPFYLDIGFSKAEIASVAKIYGVIVSLVGAGAGGWAVIRFGVARCLIIATVLIASTNLFFAMMVSVGAEIWMLTVTISADNFAMGFGGTVFIAYLSSLVNQEFTATQYALMSSLMALLGKATAGYSGNVQESLGWLGFFFYAAALGIPAILLAFVVARRHDALVDKA
ncbi:MAG TPA: AmpG family muropeptide MFS transporter [Woeseiaceae bacterium]|nr:AmpG family muropeptide MFS transporter [Woeseiaceae bacterium]